MRRADFSSLVIALLFLAMRMPGRAQTAPANDDLASAQVVTGSNFEAAGDDSYATAETNEPAADGSRTIWYLWTAPAALNATFTTNADSTGTVLNVYQVSGTGVPVYSQINEVASNSSGGTTTSVTFPTAANTTYAIVVGTYVQTAPDGAVTLSLASTAGDPSWVGPAPPATDGPANDNLAGAQPLTGAQCAAVGFEGAATTEANEPAGDGDNTIWYVWTAPSDLTVSLTTSASTPGTVLNAYQVSGTGAPGYSQFVYVASAGNSGTTATITFPVAANTTYAFAVGATGAAIANGAVVLSLASVQAPAGWVGPPPPDGIVPANDNLADAQPLTGSQVTVIGYSGSATTESGEPAGDGDNTIWYVWTAPGNLNVTLTTTVQSIGTVVSAYQVSGAGQPGYGHFNYVASNGAYGYSATVTFPAAANTTYAFAVGTYSTATANGAVSLTLTSTPGGASWAGPAPPTGAHPANDNLANAQPVTGPVFSVVGYDGAATTESAEPAGDGDNTIWYLWTAPANLNVTLSTAASSAGTILSAYQVGGSGAPAYNAFIPIASNGSGGYSATVSFPVTANTTYAFAVGTYATAPGNGSVILSMASVPLGLAGPVFRSPPPVGGTPANDDFANAQVIRDADFYVMTYNASATTEAGEHPATGLHTVWYSWTPQASGVTIIHTVFATYAHQLSVFTGTGIATAVQIVPTQYGNAGSSGVLDSAGFMAAAHTTYHIAVGCQYSDLANAQLIMGLTGPGKNVFTNAGRFAGFLDPGQDSFIKMLIGSGGSVTGEAVIDGQVMKLGGAFNISGDYSKTISGTIFQFYLDPTGLSTTMTGSVTTGSATYPVSLDLTAYGGAVPPPPPRRYTVLIAPDPNAGPAGYGAGTLSVLTQGGVTFAGRLADGTSFSTGGWIANSGTWDLFLPLYSNTGRLTGQVSFHPVQGVSDFSANITWVKPTSPKGGPGFIAASTMAGSLYTAQRPALSPAGPETASFSAGGLASAAEYPGLLQVGGAAKGNGITLDFNKSTGVITGSFLPPGATKKINLYGVAFQDQDMAAGYFLGPDAPGCFLLED